MKIATCTACKASEANQQSGSYHAGCIECKARSIAKSPAYWAADKAGAITDAYKAVLQRSFLGDWKAGHAMVKRVAERLNKNERNQRQ